MGIYLSPPDVGPDERAMLLNAFDSGWIAPCGPHVDAFEQEVAGLLGVAGGVATCSGTAALHLALEALGIGPEQTVACPTLTFAATANAIRLAGAEPMLVDVQRHSWCIDPDLLMAAIPRPDAVIAVDLLGHPADYGRLERYCWHNGIPLIEDAAQALGSFHSTLGRGAGCFGDVAILSFNGNKIVTCGGGGMLLSRNKHLLKHARWLANQARQEEPDYEHGADGFNYRMPNLSAAIGRAQLRRLDEMMQRRRVIHARYAFKLPIAHADAQMCNRWLTAVRVEDPDAVRQRLEQEGIEARRAWTPLHMQHNWADCKRQGGGVAREIYEQHLLLPSGSTLTAEDQDRVIRIVEEE